ncbi:MAG: lysophospholipase [Anaerolineales bacterium]|nr:lysophospholipase [Anaerolineales bacterium]
MNHIEGKFKGVRDTLIYYQAWMPDGDPKAVLPIVHGLGEHSGRYLNVVEYFVPRGYVVYGMDQIGHGKSEGRREYVQRFEDFSDCFTEYLGMIKQWQPGKPIFLLSHSIGGLIAAYYLLDHQAEFQGAVFSAPVVKVASHVTQTTVFMARALSLLAPTAGVLPVDPATISRDPAVVKAYVEDPLVFHGKTSARLSAEMLRALIRVSAETGKITLPFIAMQGGADRLVDPDGAQILHEKAGSKDKTLKIYAGLYHEIFNEPEREQVFRDIESWLAAHL